MKWGFLFSFLFLASQLKAQYGFFSALPVITPDSIASSTDTFDTQDSTEVFEEENGYTEQDIEEFEETGEREEEFFISTEAFKEPEIVNLGGDGKIKITRRETGETIEVQYRDANGNYNKEALDEIKGIMRCSLTGAEKEIPIKLIELLDVIEDHFKKRGIILLSGYRTKPLNEFTPGSAKYSLHMLGWAADIKINGYSARAIRDFARKLQVGGVGYYPTMGFVHVDIGKVRYWEKRNYRKYKSQKHKYSKKG